MKNKGSALLIVLICITVMIMTAAEIAVKFNRVYFVTNNNLLYDKARWYVSGIEGVVSKYMKDDFVKTPNKIHRNMLWAQPDQVIPIDEAVISGTMYDEMGCINLNSLNTNVAKDALDTNKDKDTIDPIFEDDTYPALVFKNLLEIMGADETTAKRITDAAKDWIDSNNQTTSSLGAEDEYYAILPNPHLSNNNAFFDKSELRFMPGMTDELYRRIEPMVCVQPDASFKVSINMFDYHKAPLLSALMLNTVNVEEMVTIINERPEEGWNSASDFVQIDEITDALNRVYGLRKKLTESLTVNSNYFLAKIVVEFEDEKFAFQTRFVRDNNDLQVYQRTVGELYD